MKKRSVRYIAAAAIAALCMAAAILACVSPAAPTTYPPYPPYPAYADYPAYPPYPGQDATTAPRPSGHKVGGTVVPIPTSVGYASGTSSGTVTTPSGYYVAGITMCAGTGGNATMTLGVAGTTLDGSTQDGSVQGATITVLAGGCMAWPNPIAGALYNLGAPSTVVFGGTIGTYFIGYAGYGGSP